jgi:hypothetical protein
MTTITPQLVDNGLKHLMKNLGTGIENSSEFQNLLNQFYVTEKTDPQVPYRRANRSLVGKFSMGPITQRTKTSIPIWIVKSVCENIQINDVDGNAIMFKELCKDSMFLEKCNEFATEIGAHNYKYIDTINNNLFRPGDLDGIADTSDLSLFEFKRKVSPEEIRVWSQKVKARRQVRA